MNIERWGLFEYKLNSPTQYENPFRDVTLTAAFTCEAGTKTVEGFYDGDDTWVIRFMPEHLGPYSFQTASSDSALDRRTGSFVCIAPSAGNHGPVHVDKQYHFSYADGTPFFPLGTTGYGWTYRPEEVRTQTLTSYQKYGFNKIRMLLTPKHFEGDDAQGDVRLVGFENLMEDMNTFQNNMISFAAALKTLEIIDRDALLQNCTEIGEYFVMRLKKMQAHHPEIGDIRGIGLAMSSRGFCRKEDCIISTRSAL